LSVKTACDKEKVVIPEAEPEVFLEGVLTEMSAMKAVQDNCGVKVSWTKVYGAIKYQIMVNGEEKCLTNKTECFIPLLNSSHLTVKGRVETSTGWSKYTKTSTSVTFDKPQAPTLTPNNPGTCHTIHLIPDTQQATPDSLSPELIESKIKASIKRTKRIHKAT